MVGHPPNIIIGSRGGLTFNDFVVHMGPIVVVVFVLFVLMCRFMVRRPRCPSTRIAWLARSRVGRWFRSDPSPNLES
jgi:Na+/H+ antiporter NhaD/arsenite permease-like protein